MSIVSNPTPIVPITIETLVVTSDGQTVFALLNTPVNPTEALVFINGQYMTEGVSFSITGSTLTMSLTGFALETVDQLIIRYQ